MSIYCALPSAKAGCRERDRKVVTRMRGIVHEVKGDLAMVKIQRKEACGECRACFSGMMKTEMDIEAKNLCDAEEGDWVELELQENAFFNAVIVMYGLPFIGFIVGIVLGVGLFISILSFYILMLSIFLLLQKNTTKLESLLLIGYSPNRVALPYQILTVGLNIIVLILSVGLVCWLRSYYIESIRLLFPQLETGSLWAAVSMGILLFLIVSVINILAVKRKVLSIWMHKS